jgi:DNA helicase-2/ATP-dependent DNA helicase PcrA
MGEFMRAPEISRPKPQKSGAAGYGIVRMTPGTRVAHDIFGDGEVVSARDMGGDILYEVKFDNGQTKKLMATFAKLRKI